MDNKSKLILSIPIFITSLILTNNIYLSKSNTDITNALTDKKSEIDELNIQESCLNSYQSLINITNNLNNYLSNHKVSIYYYEPDNNYSYIYNIDQVYYAASTIKLYDALYLLEKADNNEIDLNTTIKYNEDDLVSFSDIMEEYKDNEDVSLRDLIKYSIIYSDNTAHHMLYNYITLDNLKSYQESLGMVSTITDTDHFGNTTARDSMKGLEELYKYLNTNTSNANDLKEYLLNSDKNYLKTDSIDALTKYGEYDNFFHQNGIVYASTTYLVSILTNEGPNNKSLIEEINSYLLSLSDASNKVHNTCNNT